MITKHIINNSGNGKSKIVEKSEKKFSKLLNTASSKLILGLHMKQYIYFKCLRTIDRVAKRIDLCKKTMWRYEADSRMTVTKVKIMEAHRKDLLKTVAYKKMMN